ncbi:hypothetical protein GCM10020220_102140 [Nonomuraea rubra]
MQLDAYYALCAELCPRVRACPTSRVAGHKEVNTGKVDPHSINMNSFRSRVAALIKNPRNAHRAAGGRRARGSSLWVPVMTRRSRPVASWRVRWHTEYTDDPPGHNADGVAVMAKAARWCIVDGLVKVRGLKPGTEIDVAWSRYSRARQGVRGRRLEAVLPRRRQRPRRVQRGRPVSLLNTKNQLRLRIINPTDAAAVVGEGDHGQRSPCSAANCGSAFDRRHFHVYPHRDRADDRRGSFTTSCPATTSA